MARKILSWMLVILGSLFLVLSIAAMFAVWIYNEPLTTRVTAQLDQIDRELATAETNLQRSQQELARALRIVDSTQAAHEKLAQQTSSAESLFDSIQGSLLAQYRELAAFAQFGRDLDKATQAQINRGARLTEVLKQGLYEPLPVGKQVLIIFAGTNGYLDELPVAEIGRYQQELFKFLESRRPAVVGTLADKKVIDEGLREEIHGALKEFGKEFAASLRSAAA